MLVVLGSDLGGLEQLEVRVDAGQGSAELVGSVGDELTLALERLLPLRVGLVQSLEHAVHRAGELADLVVGLRHGDALRGIAGAADPARQSGEGLDRAHRAIGDRQPGEQGQDGAAEDAGAEEEPEPRDGVVRPGAGARVLDVGGERADRGDRLGRHAQVPDVVDSAGRCAEADLRIGPGERAPVLVEDLDLGILGKREGPEGRGLLDDLAVDGVGGDAGLGRE